MTEDSTITEDAVVLRRRLRFLLILLWLFLGASALLAFLWSRSPSLDATDPGTALPMIKEAPDFALTNRDGSTVDLARLEGKPWVADFVFTSCPGVCPILSERMQDLAADVSADEVNLVSFSVDPLTDTPEVLEAYARKHEAGPNWYFLTGPRDEIHRVVREGFMLVLDDSARSDTTPVTPMSRPVPPDGTPPEDTASEDTASDSALAEPIVHSNRFVLVDGENRIRGYYNAFDAQELEQLRVDLAALLR